MEPIVPRFLFNGVQQSIHTPSGFGYEKCVICTQELIKLDLIWPAGAQLSVVFQVDVPEHHCHHNEYVPGIKQLSPDFFAAMAYVKLAP